VDTRPEFLYVFAAARGIARPVLIERVQFLLRGALAWYRKPAGLVILDRDGCGFEVAMSRPNFQLGEAD
jgi:hypothetical protein